MRSYFLPNNCGKEAVTLNLGEAEGRRILRELVRALRVDVFATNQRPRSYAKLRSEEHTSELQSRLHLVCRLLLEKKKKNIKDRSHDHTEHNCSRSPKLL